ncbi:MAG: cyclic nucleotide-binding domain-containing protein [Desulfobulbaceae bacterium]|nr:cyclic nucleotide-binding domain-containing protein [Desulfobulbaceae bacterium]MCK5340779.1 cyclic nucleotide-binding domain-containing protein [Desulfobulbaceae bacterium]MCK5404879.1 cyclic nucleotide-binding domain-containing protein [Desulfobulbaceae bacterium]
MRETNYLKENEGVLNILKRIEKFQTFSDDDLHSFLELGKLLEYKPGEEIVKKGEVDHWAYFLISGRVKVVKEKKTLGILEKSGELFGEMGVIDGSPRTASIWALDKTLVLGVDCSLLGKEKETPRQLAFHYTIFRLFAEVLADRLRVTTSELTKVADELEKLKKKVSDGGDEKEETLWV